MLMIFIMNLLILISIAFFTLMERKILGYIQTRKGPNKTIFSGISQPLIDGIKLFLKENTQNFNKNKILFSLFPFIALFLMLTYWLNYNYLNMNFMMHSIIFFMFLSNISVYNTLGSGWASNSKYALIGAYRSLAQVVSYEIGMMFYLLLFFMEISNFNMQILNDNNFMNHMKFFGLSVFFISWFTIIMAELNRSPFDFSESESELVSGFNIEYGAIKFSFLFLTEYGSMIFLSYITSLLFFNNNITITIFMMIILVWIRGTLPRFRYDNLMFLNWMIFLPQILMVFLIMLLWVHI